MSIIFYRLDALAHTQPAGTVKRVKYLTYSGLRKKCRIPSDSDSKYVASLLTINKLTISNGTGFNETIVSFANL